LRARALSYQLSSRTDVRDLVPRYERPLLAKIEIPRRCPASE
jgi:hypothetical protein